LPAASTPAASASSALLSGSPRGPAAGTSPAYFDWMNFRTRLARFPKVPSSSAFTLDWKSL
jgi:hypothetical protein